MVSAVGERRGRLRQQRKQCDEVAMAARVAPPAAGRVAAMVRRRCSGNTAFGGTGGAGGYGIGSSAAQVVPAVRQDTSAGAGGAQGGAGGAGGAAPAARQATVVQVVPVVVRRQTVVSRLVVPAVTAGSRER